MGRKKRTKHSGSIAYQNKDITSKVLAENFKGKTFRVYGLNLPKIEEASPTNIPAVTANELRLDNLFRLADQTVAIVDYESEYKKADKVKYLNYLAGIVNRYRKEKKDCPLLRMVVIYTGDVERRQVSDSYDLGAVKMRIETAFLSELDGDSISRRLEERVKGKQPFTDEELMEYMILPLSYKEREAKQQKIRELAELAEEMADKKQQVFVLSGMLAFTDKVIDEETANKIREVIKMTKVERMIRNELRTEVKEEVREEVRKEERAKREAEREKERLKREAEREKEKLEREAEREKEKLEREAEKKQCVIRMIERGDSTEGILYVIPGFSYQEVEKMRRECEKSSIV